MMEVTMVVVRMVAAVVRQKWRRKRWAAKPLPKNNHNNNNNKNKNNHNHPHHNHTHHNHKVQPSTNTCCVLNPVLNPAICSGP